MAFGYFHKKRCLLNLVRYCCHLLLILPLLLIPSPLALNIPLIQDGTVKKSYSGDIRDLYKKDSQYLATRILKRYIEITQGDQKKQHALSRHYHRRLVRLQNNIHNHLAPPPSCEDIASGQTPQKAHQLLQKDSKPPEIIIYSHETTQGRGIAAAVNRDRIKGRAMDESGISEIRINNQIVKFDPDGSFKANIALESGRNSVVVTATDTYQNTSIKQFDIALHAQADIWENTIQNEYAGRYHALIIGNDNYKHIKHLQTAVRDARDVESILKQHYGFKTKLLINATRTEILYAINYYRQVACENDKLLIYYAGHSVFDKLADKAYWLPVDALPDNDTHWIIIDAITSNIRRFVSKHILIVADSCYSGTFTRRIAVDMRAGRERNRYLHKMASRTSRTLMASGGNEPVSDLGSEKNSVFAKAFMTGLQKMERDLFTAEELFHEYIRSYVAGNSFQTPEYNAIRNSGHEGGDFLFYRITN